MKIKLLFILASTLGCWGTIIIHSPTPNHMTSSPVIHFNAESPVNQGFFMINEHIVPIRKQSTLRNIPLHLGMNTIHVHVLSEDLTINPALTQTLTIYRQLPTNSPISPSIARLLTDLAINHSIRLVNNGDAMLDAPILKKDMYACLMWFHQHRSPQPIKHQYLDMSQHEPYLTLYRHLPSVLPMPIRGSFFPNGHLTRQDVINALLLVNGSPDQISTSMLVTPKLTVPPSLQHVIPTKWEDPMAFVSRREVLQIFFDLFSQSPLSTASEKVSIEWPKTTWRAPIQIPNRLLSQWGSRITKARTMFYNWLNQAKQPPTPSQPVAAAPKQTLLPKKQRKTYQKPSPKPMVVVVKKGDSIQRIAGKHYGDPSKWRQLAAINKLKIRHVTVNGQTVSTVHITPGQTLQLL
ncbi:MAG: LysM peptidoglycan-binding domain-containing protein [Candidatus Margulisbacteria bacterium]|nr:LysM peptidoglycan-binding domain-containing protein [Candidatus Margulisiibacteriota bacterium]